MIEEGADELRVKISQVHLGRVLARLGLGIAEQEPEGVPVGVDGVRAGVEFATEARNEERLNGGERARSPPGCLACLEPFACHREQLRHARQIPIGRSRVDMAHLG